MKILCTVCARGGSQGVKNKNIRLLRGKPLIAHSLLQAKKTNIFSYIAVSSDSPIILRVAKEWGADGLIERPSELATAEAAKLPVIQHALLAAEHQCGEKFDVVIDLDATSPLRTAEDIIAALDQLNSHPEASNVVTACPARRSPYFNMLEQGEDGFVRLPKKLDHAIVRRQDAPRCYDMNASIYVWKRETLLHSQRTITDRTVLYVMPEERSVDIDSLLDWQIVSLLAKSRKDLAHDAVPEFI